MKYLARDQYGQFWAIQAHPRSELMEQLGRKSAEKMYVDRSDGVYHIGYIIAGHWLTVWGVEGITFASLA